MLSVFIYDVSSVQDRLLQRTLAAEQEPVGDEKKQACTEAQKRANWLKQDIRTRV
ncbi:hypothetical protein N656DRAFT_782150 [Canariomyces notabilis]|uniref:Uncharacterized protein n=1 Tax=Canariomyces notabilis TaxID=2074819 RepID=A0AAN6TAJ4_9PEZI|nr:hypothetical protein N656DRAFT_782150 [Canariomyces arenarius]